MNYIPVTDKEKQEMLDVIGVKYPSELFSSIPQQARIEELRLPGGISEMALISRLEALEKKNISLKEFSSFRGAGIYDHFIPSAVGEIIGRSEFATAYTPYQPEASQGTLQAIFEYQSLICALTGMDVSNASLYDGASAAAEAAMLAVRATGRNKLVVSSAIHPEYQQVLKTYLQGSPVEILTVPFKNGVTAVEEAKLLIDSTTAALIIQSPNFFGSIEELTELNNITHSAGALLAMIVNPVSLGILKSPGECGADIAAGEGQALGNPSGCGGIAFGFLACKKELAWKMSGRIAGQTFDAKGRRGFVLTLQSREQHIRREKATSNICTNSALNALAGCVYLAGWGPEGLKELALNNVYKSHYAYERIIKMPGFNAMFQGQAFFNEFVVQTKKDIGQLQKKMLTEKIIGPLELRRFYPDLPDCLMFCVTETKTREEIDRMINILAD